MVEIREIRRQDYKKAQEFAIQGMHFDWYMDSRFLLKLYAGYFWNMEFNRATKAYGAYIDDEFKGVLLADIKGESPQYYSRWRAAYVSFFDWLQNLIAGKGVDVYDKANQKMYRDFCKTNTPDGEIIFLAANLDGKIKGIGTALLSALENDEKGKLVYLYTDNACTYQFYEHRGFARAGEEPIMLDLRKKKVPLTCFLYAKRL